MLAHKVEESQGVAVAEENAGSTACRFLLSDSISIMDQAQQSNRVGKTE